MSSLLHQKLDKVIWVFSMYEIMVGPTHRTPRPTAARWYPPCERYSSTQK